MIELKGIRKTFPNESTIVYHDLAFEDGKKYMLLGASGCGKSTLLNIIAGILSPDEGGQVLIGDRDLCREGQKARDKFRIENIGYIFQDFKLIEEMTVLDNIRLLKLEGVDVSRAPEMLEAIGLGSQKNKKVRQLSGGQKQRVAIVRALVKNPNIILADEPTGNLNYEIGREVMRELSEAAEGKILIAVTHDERLADFFDVVLDMNGICGRK